MHPHPISLQQVACLTWSDRLGAFANTNANRAVLYQETASSKHLGRLRMRIQPKFDITSWAHRQGRVLEYRICFNDGIIRGK